MLQELRVLCLLLLGYHHQLNSNLPFSFMHVNKTLLLGSFYVVLDRTQSVGAQPVRVSPG